VAPAPSAEVVQQAWADYRAAADAAGVEVRIVTAADAWDAATLLEQIWGVKPIEAPMLIALARSGNYAAVAVDGEQILAVTAGYFAAPVGTALHSHVAGVRPGLGGRGIGRVVKLHQRAWCLELGLTQVLWTFDPLVARNAYINVERLGAGLDQYVIDYYGHMTDGINAGQGSDRAIVRWHLERPYAADRVNAASRDLEAFAVLAATIEGDPSVQPLPASATALTVAVPPDIEAMRADDPVTAKAWRAALRDTLPTLLAAGWRVRGFDSSTGYYLERD